MKKTLLLFVLFVVAISITKAQDGINYQAVVRDDAGELMKNEAVAVEFSIVETSTAGAKVYTETHALTTNNFGNIVALIGQGTPTLGTFAAVDWASDKHFLNVVIDGTDMGTTEFLSVPYALHAKTADELIDPIWKKNGNAAYNLEDKIVVGSLNPDADGLTIKSGNYSSGELVDFRSDTLAGGADVLNMYVYNVDHATDPAQFIEMSVAGSGTMFRLNTDGTLQKTSLTGSADMLPIAYGNVNSAGVLNSGTSNVGTITKVSTGNYNVAINNETANINDYIVVLNSISNSSVNVSWTISGGSFRIYTRNVTTDLYADARFNFIIYKP